MEIADRSCYLYGGILPPYPLGAVLDTPSTSFRSAPFRYTRSQTAFNIYSYTSITNLISIVIHIILQCYLVK